MTIKASRIRRLLQAAYKPVVAAPEFKVRLLKRLLSEFARREVKKMAITFDEWYEEFQKALADESRLGMIPNGMDKESYREDYDDGMSPWERADQELDDLARSS